MSRRPTYDLILAALVNLTAKAGDNLVFKATFTEESGSDWDLLQYDTIVFEVKPNSQSSRILITADLNSGLTIEGVNTLDFNIPGATMDVAGGNYVYEVTGTAVGLVETILGGQFSLRD